MSDYVKREDALKWCRPEEWGTPDERWRPESEFGKMIKALPAADVKPELPPRFDDDDIEAIRIIVHAYIENLCNASRYKDAMEIEKSLDKFIYLAKVVADMRGNDNG